MPEAQSMGELAAMLVAFVFLGGSVFIVWVVRQILGVEGQAVLIALLAVPVLVYFIVSGKLKELRSPWGSATFQASEPVSDLMDWSDFKVEMATDEKIKAVARGDQQRLEMLQRTQPALLSLELGREEPYRPEQLAEYVDVLGASPNFRSVVFVNQEGRFEASMSARTFMQMLQSERREALVEAINRGDVRALAEISGVVTLALAEGATNERALRAMDTANTDTLVVLDEDERPTGVVEKSKIVSHLLRPPVRELRRPEREIIRRTPQERINR